MKKDKSILVIDDEDSICLAFSRFFENRGWTVGTAASADEGLAQYLENRHSVIFLDVRLPDRSGLELLEELKQYGADVVVITAYGGLDTVVLAIQGKAYDYLAKPIDLDKALAIADRILKSRVSETPERNPHTAGENILIGKSPAMQEVYKLIARAAATDSPVLIEGETGTGKELAAKAIHQFSTLRNGPFLAVNCGAIPENLIESELFGHIRGAFTGADNDRAGRFESAHQGTLLLDEVGELPFASQVKLLRVLDNGVMERVGSSQSIQLDVRIIAATNRRLTDEIDRGRFRKDLFYRLAVLNITIPPLRSRREDIPLLADHFLSAKRGLPNTSHVISDLALRVLMKHEWYGNVRELKNAIEHAMAVAPDRPIAEDDLPQSIRSGKAVFRSDDEHISKAVVDYIKGIEDTDIGRYRSAIEAAERAMIYHALEQCRGKQSEAADYLGLHRNTLRKKLRELNITLPN